MKTLLISITTLIFFCFAQYSHAQCCATKRKAGQEAFEKGDYDIAIQKWQEAKGCTDAVNCPDLEQLIAKAQKAKAADAVEIDRKKELRAWNRAQNAGTVEAYQRYLKAFPYGPHAELARGYIEEKSDDDLDGILNKNDKCRYEKGVAPNGCPQKPEPPHVPPVPEEARFYVKINNQQVSSGEILWVAPNTPLVFGSFALDGKSYTCYWDALSGNPQQVTFSLNSSKELITPPLQTPGVYSFSVYASGENILRRDYVYQVGVYEYPVLSFSNLAPPKNIWQYSDFYGRQQTSTFQGSFYQGAWYDSETGSSGEAGWYHTLTVEHPLPEGQVVVENEGTMQYGQYVTTAPIDLPNGFKYTLDQQLPRGNHSIVLKYKGIPSMESNPLNLNIKSRRLFPLYASVDFGDLRYPGFKGRESYLVTFDSLYWVLTPHEKDSLMQVAYSTVCSGDTLISMTDTAFRTLKSYRTQFVNVSLGFDLPYSAVEFAYFFPFQPSFEHLGNRNAIASWPDTVFYEKGWERKVSLKPVYSIKFKLCLSKFWKTSSPFDVALYATMLHAKSFEPVVERSGGNGSPVLYDLLYPEKNLWFFGANLGVPARINHLLFHLRFNMSWGNSLTMTHGGLDLRMLF